MPRKPDPAGRTRRRTGHEPKPDEPAKLSRSPVLPALGGPALAAPEHLGEKMRPTWDAVVGMISQRAPAGLQDLIAVELIVRQYHRLREAGELVDGYGMATRKVSGDVGSSPFVRVERDASAMLLRLLEEYGLTYQSRMRLGLMQVVGRTLGQALNDSLNG